MIKSALIGRRMEVRSAVIHVIAAGRVLCHRSVRSHENSFALCQQLKGAYTPCHF